MSRSPDINATISEPVPEPKPFIITIFAGSFLESLRVQLFSRPQQQQASKARSEYTDMENDPLPLNESMMLAVVISVIAIQRRGDIFSLKNRSAIRAVATISKLLSRDTDSAEEFLSAVIRSIGAAISSRTIIMR